MANIAYATPRLAAFFSTHRQRWDEFYPSERFVFEAVARNGSGSLGHVLDVGCAAGGLGRALAEKFALASYTGVDISAPAVAAGLALGGLPRNGRLLAADILETDLDRPAFDLVVSLSCADWNVETRAIIGRCWDLVAPGGRFVASLRLTPGRSLTDRTESFQYLAFDGEIDPEGDETAPYVVFNVADALGLLTGLPAAAHLLAYGYWGPVSVTARTPIDKAVFAVVAVTKGEGGPLLDLRLPRDIWARP